MAVSTVSLGKGDAELVVSTIGYGCMGLTAFYGNLTPEEEALKVLRSAYDLGVRHFDTAQIYARTCSDGTVHYNEELVGKFLASLSPEERKNVSVATKYFPGKDPYKFVGVFNEEAYRKATLDSLKRLGVDSIDLYYFHRAYKESEVPVETWMGAAKKLVAEGIIKRIGLSEANATIIRKANEVHPITCVQQEWSLFVRDLEETIVPCCQELGIGIISYSPIGRGFLAGAFAKKGETPTDGRANIPYLSAEHHESNLVLLAEFKKIADAKGCSVGQLALAWVIAKGAVPIPGTTKLHHLEDNMGAVNVKLSEADIHELGELGNKVSGQRANEQYMSRTFNAL